MVNSNSEAMRKAGLPASQYQQNSNLPEWFEEVFPSINHYQVTDWNGRTGGLEGFTDVTQRKA
jgi:hypothetical protein